MLAASVGALLTVFIPFLTRKILKDYLPANDMKMICVFLAIMFICITANAYLGFVRVKWGHILGVRMEADMRSDIFRHIQKLSFNYFDNVKTGHIMSRISNDLNMIAEIAHHAPEDLIISTVVITGAFVAMFIFSTPLAMVSLFPLIAILLWGLFYGRSMRQGFRSVRKRIADINSSVENSVQGIREVKAFTNEDQEIDRFCEVNYNFRMAKEHMFQKLGIFFSGMLFLTELYFFLVISVGVAMIYSGRFNIGTADLVGFILYIYFILKPIQRLINFAEQFQQGAACFERYIEVMDIEPDIVDDKKAYRFEPVHGTIEIKDLTFHYNSSSNEILKNISMQIPAHRRVAIVGESGAGKSTIVSLIPRFYEPQKGVITIDGHDISNLEQKFLRDNIGIVQQSVFLFDTTIRENILYGQPDASEVDIHDAARKANIYDFIMTLPEGFDTLVGERGVKLSGGQKQRISIARVFLKNPPIFIFDEATSSLDSESESLVQQSLERLSEGRTTIVIAHRLSTVKNSDYLYVLKAGEVVEHGTHEKLLESESYYHRLYTMNLF